MTSFHAFLYGLFFGAIGVGLLWHYWARIAAKARAEADVLEAKVKSKLP